MSKCSIHALASYEGVFVATKCKQMDRFIDRTLAILDQLPGGTKHML